MTLGADDHRVLRRIQALGGLEVVEREGQVVGREHDAGSATRGDASAVGMPHPLGRPEQHERHRRVRPALLSRSRRA